jgi:hypothetical protein
MRHRRKTVRENAEKLANLMVLLGWQPIDLERLAEYAIGSMPWWMRTFRRHRAEAQATVLVAVLIRQAERRWHAKIDAAQD